MSSIDTSTLSRRQFLSTSGACGTVGVAALASTPAAADGRERLPPPNEVGAISAEGQAAISVVDDQLAQQDNISRTINAVSGLGLDPSGNTPISQPLEAATENLSNARIVFPADGVFRLADRIVLDPGGPIELVGNGATLKLDSGTEVQALNCPNMPSGTIIRDFVIDQTAKGAVSGIRIGTEGTVEVRNVTIKGYAPPTPSESVTGDVAGVLMPIARTPSATVRITNFTAIGGTAAGMHTDPDKPESAPENRLGAPLGMWVGESNRGTVQLVNPRMRGWSNGTYSSRTPGQVQILGGVLWNNSNTQARVGGGAVIDGTTMILDDREWSTQQNPGPYTLGGNQGVHAVRVETGGEKGTQSKPVRLRNLDIRGLSMATSSSLINFEGSAPAGSIRNCRVTNHLDVPSLLAVSPGSQGGYEAAAQTNVLVDQCLLTGSTSSTVLEVDDRPSSRIRRTCIQIPDTGTESISGMQIGAGVSFGQTCAAGGLRKPSAVGSGANLSAMNFSAAGGGAPTGTGRQVQLKAIARHITVTVLLVLALVAVMVLFSLGGLWKLID